MAVTGALAKADKDALYDMINDGSALTASTLASGDYIGVGDISATTGAKITVANLINFLFRGDKMLDLNSYSILLNYTSNANNLNLSFNGYDILLIHGNDSRSSYHHAFSFLYEVNEKKLLGCGSGNSNISYFVNGSQYSFSTSAGLYRFHTVTSNFQLRTGGGENTFTFNATSKTVTNSPANVSNNILYIIGLKYKLMT